MEAHYILSCIMDGQRCIWDGRGWPSDHLNYPKAYQSLARAKLTKRQQEAVIGKQIEIEEIPYTTQPIFGRNLSQPHR